MRDDMSHSLDVWFLALVVAFRAKNMFRRCYIYVYFRFVHFDLFIITLVTLWLS